MSNNSAEESAQNIKAMEQNKIYAREMRAVRKLAQWADRHQNIINTLIAIQAAATAFYVYMYN